MAKVITICSSAAFYKHVTEIMDQLKDKGYDVIIPKTALIMRERNDFDVSHYKTWLKDASKKDKKKELMDNHFKEVEKADAVLIVNDEKHGIKGYIGGNVLMEIALAYWLKKKIFVLNTVDENHSVYEEILGIDAVQLHGDITQLSL